MKETLHRRGRSQQRRCYINKKSEKLHGFARHRVTFTETGTPNPVILLSVDAPVQSSVICRGSTCVLIILPKKALAALDG